MARVSSTAKIVDPLRVYLLGSLRVERDGQTIHLPTRKVESLLAYLVLHPESHSREKLAGLLWGDSTDEQARHSLRTALATLRKELGDELILADRETVQINPDLLLWVDTREFQFAIELYQGDLLTDFYGDWILPEREHLRAIYLDALLGLAKEARSQSQYTRAIEFAHKILASDPANEKAFQHIIFCLAATGDRIGALKQYDECEKKLRDELGVEPSKETLALRGQIDQALTGGKSREALFTNVPTPLTSFVGRQRELAELRELLENTRLLTLTGAGGCGKTRLAIQAATDFANANRFQHGVWWVELAALNDPALVPQTVASAFDLEELPDAPIATVLTDYLRAKELLLVLDNCEHLIAACAQLVEQLLSASPQLKIIATSREALNVMGEVIWRVPSLGLPEARDLSATQLIQYDAIQLFVQRTQAVAPGWKLEGNAEAVSRICKHLDGIPLALELAAARVKALSVEQIAARLDDRFRLLTGGSRTALPRHQTLRATMDWSYILLSDAERVLLRRLAVFAGGWTLEAVEAVCADLRLKDHLAIESQKPLHHPQGQVSKIENATIIDLLSSLIDKSLVVVEHKGNETRYHLLETIRQYAREKLLEANESEIYSRRHRDWFLRLAEQAAPKLRGREQLEWCERLDLEIENLRAALMWSLGQTDHANAEIALRLAGALWWFWLIRGYWNEGRTWLERSLENGTITPARAMPLVGLALMERYAGTPEKRFALDAEALALYRQQGDKWGIAFAASFCGGFESAPSKANALYEEARSIARELNDEWLAARTDIGQGSYYHRRGEFALARPLAESALDHARRAGDRWTIGNALITLEEIARDQGDFDQAEALLTESLELRRELGNKNSIAGQIYGLAELAWRRNDCHQAKMLLKQAVTLLRETGNTHGVVQCLWIFGRVAVTEQRYERAARLFGSVDARSENLRETKRREYEGNVRALCAQLGEAAFDQARAEGRAMTLEQAIEYALENVKSE